MGNQSMRKVLSKAIVLSLIALLTVAYPIAAQSIIADHTVVHVFDQIPASVIEGIKNSYRIFYCHTSHGSQIVTGMDMVRDENPLYDYNNSSGTLSLYEYGDDLGHVGDTSWAPITRNALSSDPSINMVIWSWCGGCSDNTEEGINIYLNKFNELEQDYPNVKFVYMTGHLDGTGIDGNLYARNNQIRAYCLANGKTLFDFADIESYDPDGNYYPDETDACEWCDTWCAAHVCPDCGGCAHSHCFNCYQKGKAFWWMMAKIDGWEVVPDSCGDANGNSSVNALDITFLINYLYKGGGAAPNPLWKGDANGNGIINALDITYLINYLFKGGAEPVCP
jgi:hypothetical protein